MAWKSKLESNPNYVQAIGMITIEMANVEMFLGRLLSEVQEVAPNIGQAIYWAPKSACARIKILKSASKQKFKPIPFDDSLNIKLHKKATTKTLKEIKKLLERSTSCIGRRNDIIHGVWGQNSATGAVSRVETHDLSSQIHVPINELNKLIYDMRSIIDDARPVIDRLQSERIDRIQASMPGHLSNIQKRLDKIAVYEFFIVYMHRFGVHKHTPALDHRGRDFNFIGRASLSDRFAKDGYISTHCVTYVKGIIAKVERRIHTTFLQ